MKLLYNIGQLVRITDSKKQFLLSPDTQNLYIEKDAAILISDRIEWVGRDWKEYLATNSIQAETIDMKGALVMPALTDPHTHYPFAGDRAGEFARRLAGVSYEEIAREGGGIQNTVAATREASLEELTENVIRRARIAVTYGITAIEMKSGYTLSREGELRQLEAVKQAADALPVTCVPTLLAAHDFPKELKTSSEGRRDYIKTITEEIIPEAAEKDLAKYNDVFIDEGYYTVEEGIEVLEAGKKYGLAARAHCDELADTGSSKAVAEIGGVSVDHLIRINDEGIEALRKNKTVACLLPGTSYFIRKPYAPARKILDAGVITTLATDCNPGSSYTENLQLIMQLACINGGMNVNEALAAATINSAFALDLSGERGSIEVGKQADLAVMDVDSAEEIIYHHGINHCRETWSAGERIWHRDEGFSF